MTGLSARTIASDFAADLLGPWAGFFTGWTYWFCWIVTGIADVIAISGYFKYWWPGLAAWIPALLTIAALLLLNLPTVRAFGETEFWFALIKIIAIVSLIVVGIVMVVSGFTAPNGATSGIDNLWNDGGMFPTGFMGFVADFQKEYGRLPTLYASQGYDAAQMYEAGLRAAGGDPAKKEAVIKGMESATIDSPRGKWTMSKAHNPIQDIYLRRVENKENKVISVAAKALADSGAGCRLG